MKVALAILLCAAAASGALAAGTFSVTQSARSFSVRTLQIARSDVVQFLNQDDFEHQIYVKSPTFNFESPEQPPSKQVDLRFSTAGTFEVRCRIHPKMLLTVDVR